jgi:hypothetical protein
VQVVVQQRVHKVLVQCGDRRVRTDGLLVSLESVKEEGQGYSSPEIGVEECQAGSREDR